MTSEKTPTTDEFRPDVLRVLADGQVRPFRDVHRLVADLRGLDAETRAETIASGQPRYVNRIGWACSGLRYAGLLERPQRGYYRITEDGQSVNRRNLSIYSEEDMLEWPKWANYQAEIAERRQTTSPEPSGMHSAAVPSSGATSEASIEELMASSQRSYNAQTETILRQRLQESSPEFFEKAVIELLWAMGYGGAHGEKQHMGQSGDGGIDGIIRQDALGLSSIYIQAKRYANTNRVGDVEMRNFIGSLMAQGANQGVFITTSTFLPKAVETAEQARHSTIILIDGLKLTRLMLDYEVAVQKAHEYTLFKIDEDFFDSEAV